MIGMEILIGFCFFSSKIITSFFTDPVIGRVYSRYKDNCLIIIPPGGATEKLIGKCDGEVKRSPLNSHFMLTNCIRA